MIDHLYTGGTPRRERRGRGPSSGKLELRKHELLTLIFSLLHGRTEVITLAPLYDVMSTRTNGENRLAMYIDGLQRMDRVTSERIVNEAASWGISRRRAIEIVTDILDRAPAAADAAASKTKTLPVRLRREFDVQLVAPRGTLPSSD